MAFLAMTLILEIATVSQMAFLAMTLILEIATFTSFTLLTQNVHSTMTLWLFIRTL